MSALEQISKQRTFLMGLAILAVLLYHQYFVNDIWLQVFARFGGWGVEVFMFVSGIGIAYSLGKNSLPTYYGNRLWRILPAYVIAILIYILILIAEGQYCPESWMEALKRWWFIKAILLFYLIAPLLRNILTRWGLLGFAGIFLADIVLLACGHLQILPSFLDSNLPLMECTTRLPAFALGMALVLWPESAGRIAGDGLRKWLLLPLLLVAISLRVSTAGKSIGVLPPWMLLEGGLRTFLFDFQRILFCFITPALCLVVSRIPLRSRVITLCGTLSLELYLLHELIFWKAYNLFGWIPVGSCQGYLVLAGTLILSLFSAWLLSLVCRSIVKWGKRLFIHSGGGF